MEWWVYLIIAAVVILVLVFLFNGNSSVSGKTEGCCLNNYCPSGKTVAFDTEATVVKTVAFAKRKDMDKVHAFFMNDKITDIALSVSSQTGIPLSFAYTIIAIESSWGQSPKAVNDNNYGGIRAKKGKGFGSAWAKFSHHLECADAIARAVINSKASSITDLKKFITQMTVSGDGKRAYAPLFENPGYSKLFTSVHDRVLDHISEGKVIPNRLKEYAAVIRKGVKYVEPSDMRNIIKNLTENILVSSGLYEQREIACVHNVLLPASTTSFTNAYGFLGGNFATDNPLVRIDQFDLSLTDRGSARIFNGAGLLRFNKNQQTTSLPPEIVKMFCADKYVLRLSVPTVAVTSNANTLARSADLLDNELQFGGGIRNVIQLHIGPYLGDTESIFFEVIGNIQVYGGQVDPYGSNPPGYADVHPSNGWLVRPITQDDLFADQCYNTDTRTDVWTTSHAAEMSFNAELYSSLLGIQCYTQSVRVYTWNRELKIMKTDGIQKKGTGPRAFRYDRNNVGTSRLLQILNYDNYKNTLVTTVSGTRSNPLGETDLLKVLFDSTDLSRQ